MGIHFVLLISRQGKVRLTKWYSAMPSKERARAVREVSAVVLSRQQKQCNFLEYKDKKIIYKRCADRARRAPLSAPHRGPALHPLAATALHPLCLLSALPLSARRLSPPQIRVAVLLGLRRRGGQ